MTAQEFNYALTSLEDNLTRFAYSLTTDQDDAQDLVQETYLKALTNKDKFESDSNLKAWTFTIMKNTFINKYRRAVKHNTMVDNTKELYFLNNFQESGFEHPESEYGKNEILDTIDELEDEYRIPFKMHTEGYKYKEIADKLDLKIGTVKSRIFFTRKKLMDSLNDYAA
jgi:RNA polymerase sigma-70 factor (ECF subfamily)